MKKNLFLLGRMFFMTLCFGIMFSSCKGDDDDPTPEVATNETAFYIVGEVLSDGQALDGVTVKADGVEASTDSKGAFELKMTRRGDYKVSFSKTGYVGISSDVTISSNAGNKSSVAIRQVLSKTNPPVRVTPDEDSNIESGGASLQISAGAVREAVDISMTPFIPGAKSIKSGAVMASLISLSMEPDGYTFENPVELLLANPMGNDVAFGNMKHMVEENGTLKEVGDVSYDREKNSYKAMLNGFSNHSFTISANISVGSGRELLDTRVIDNTGNMSIKSESIAATQKFGWVIEGDLVSSLKSKYPALPDATISSLASTITATVSSLMGSNPGIGEMSLTIPFYVSGDTKQTIEFLARTENYTFSFPLIFVDGSLDFISVSAKKYIGTEVEISINGSHSGGAGQ